MYSGVKRKAFLLGQVRRRTVYSTVKMTTANVSILCGGSGAQRA